MKIPTLQARIHKSVGIVRCFHECPKCGIVSINPNTGYGENSVEVLGEDYKDRITTDFWNEYKSMTAFVETSTGELDAEMYATKQEVKERSASFDLIYTMNEQLAIKFIPQNARVSICGTQSCAKEIRS